MALGFGPMKTMPVLLKRNRERFALGQKAVARMYGLGARRLAGFDDLVHHKVGFGGRRGTDVDGLVGHVDVQRVAVGVRIDRHRLDSHLACGLDDAAGDLATICDQNFLEHRSPRSFPVIFSSLLIGASREARRRSSACRGLRKHDKGSVNWAASAIRCRTIAGQRNIGPRLMAARWALRA